MGKAALAHVILGRNVEVHWDGTKLVLEIETDLRGIPSKNQNNDNFTVGTTGGNQLCPEPPGGWPSDLECKLGVNFYRMGDITPGDPVETEEE